MPVSSENSIAGPFIPNGSTTDFPFDFKATAANEVVAVDQDGETISTALYSVTLDDDEGGTLSFSVAPGLADYSQIYVVGDPALTQPSDFDNAGPSFNPAALTRAFDRAALRDLKLKRSVDRSIRVPFGEAGPALPSATGRAGGYLAFDALGDPIASPGTGADQGLRQALATDGPGSGARLVILSDGRTVQQLADELPQSSDFIDASQPILVNAAGAMTADQFNRTLRCSGGGYTYTLPPCTNDDAGKAVYVEIARNATGVITISAAALDGPMDGQSVRDMIGGETATFRYMGDVIGWVRMSYLPVPIRSIMRRTAVLDLTSTIGSFAQVSHPVDGGQLMDQDLKAIWGYAGGYWTAPRDCVIRATWSVWFGQTGAPAQVDLGFYVGNATGGAPGDNDFGRYLVSNYGNQQLPPRVDTFRMQKGQKLYPSIRPFSPMSAASILADLSTDLHIEETPL